TLRDDAVPQRLNEGEPFVAGESVEAEGCECGGHRVLLAVRFDVTTPRRRCHRDCRPTTRRSQTVPQAVESGGVCGFLGLAVLPAAEEGVREQLVSNRELLNPREVGGEMMFK